MTIEVRQIREEDIVSFHAAIDAVAREHKYLALLEAPPIDRATAFVQRNIEKGYPQLVAVSDSRVVGWCNIPPAAREVMAHVGDLFMGLLPAWRGQGLGARLLRESLAAADAFGYLRRRQARCADSRMHRLPRALRAAGAHLIRGRCTPARVP